MNPKIKKLWVAALRSGKYKQGRAVLRESHDHFCCLGVLCDLHARAHPEIAASQDDPSRYLGCRTLLPVPVADWAGFALWESHQTYAGVDVLVTGAFLRNLRNEDTSFEEALFLSNLNDEGVSFEAIANIIEESL